MNMQAIQVHEFGEPEVMRLVEVPVPTAAEGQVLVKLDAVGVNPVDTYFRAGTHAQKPALPYTPGLDGAGIVEAVGAGVTTTRPGTRVYVARSISGTYAQYVVCAAASVRPLPDRLTFSQGAAVGIPYTTAWRALHQRAAARAGEIVLVHGASGGTGIAAVQIARAAGLTVLGTAGTEYGRALVAAQGAHHVFDHRVSGYLEDIRAATGGRGVDVVLEMLANVNAAADLSLLAMRGRIIVIGNRGTINLNLRDAMARDADIRGMLMFNATPAELEAAHAGVGAGLADGTLNPQIASELPLAEAPAAHRAVMESGAHGKIVLIP